MLERITEAKSRSRRPIAFAAALGAHALVIGALALASLRPAPAPVPINDPVIKFPPVTKNTGRAGTGGSKDVKPPPTTRETPRTHREIRPPRAEPTNPATVPIEPEQIAAPNQDVAASSSDNAGPGNVLTPGNGDAGNGVDGSGGAGVACPAGAICEHGEIIYSLGSGLSRPLPRCEPPAPSVPPAATAFGLEGRVIAQYTVHADGRADSVRILNSDAPGVYADAVREWLERCSFEPAAMGGAPQAVRMIQTFRFARK